MGRRIHDRFLHMKLKHRCNDQKAAKIADETINLIPHLLYVDFPSPTVSTYKREKCTDFYKYYLRANITPKLSCSI